MQNKNQEVINTEKSKRKIALSIGVSILLMAIISAISIPVLGTLTASIGLLAIFILDIVISIKICYYYKKTKLLLAKITCSLRIIYTAIFGIGIGYHLLENVALFNEFWSFGLIVFGLHLITLGILFNNERGKKWISLTIKSLLIVAGIGYGFLNIGILFVSNPLDFRAIVERMFIVPQIFGETFFGIWMIVKGGKNNQI